MYLSLTSLIEKMGLNLNMQLEKVDRVLQTMMMAPSRAYLGINFAQLVQAYPVRFFISTEFKFINGSNTAYICYDHRISKIFLCLKMGNADYRCFDCLSDHATRTDFVMGCQSIPNVKNETISCNAVSGPHLLRITIIDNRIKKLHSLLFRLPQ